MDKQTAEELNTEDTADRTGSSEFVISLFHGMGLQNRFMTLDELVQFLIRSLCSDPDSVMTGSKVQVRVSTHTHRDNRDRDVVLKLKASDLHDSVAARLGGRTLIIRCTEVYWAPITTGSADAWKTILWLLGGLTSVVRAFVTLPARSADGEDAKGETSRKGGRSFGQMQSAAEVWRLVKLLTRLAMVIIVLPLAVMAGSSLVVGWLAGWSVHVASRLPSISAINQWWETAGVDIHAIIANPWQLSGSPLVSMPVWLSILAVLLPLLLHYIGSSVLFNSVSTPLTIRDAADSGRQGSLRPLIIAAYLLLWPLAWLLIAGGIQSHWTVLTEALRMSIDGMQQMPRTQAWAWAALSLPLLSLLWLMLAMAGRILRREAGLPRLLGYAGGLLMISLALKGWLAFGPEAAALSVLLILLGTWLALIRRGLLFIREYLGDVAAFVSTNENDRMFALRQRILELSEEKLEQVLGYDLMPNPLVDRYEASEEVRVRSDNVIVMAHSLGTVVAYQSLCRYYERLLELDRITDLNRRIAQEEGRVEFPPQDHKRLSGELQGRLKLFVTFGCPLDTIGMAFNAQHSGKPVFDRVLSHARYLHGGSGPFKFSEWLNWWHPGDVVSAKVQWYAGERSPQNRCFPLPAPWVVNHSAYLLARPVQEDFRREFTKLL